MTNRILAPQSKVELTDLILKVKQDISYNLNFVQIGTIQSYNPLTNSASISINYKRQLPTGDVLDYPLLVDCPVFILSGGDSCITMPITIGDQCIILFNDRDIDNWHYSGTVDVPATARAHNISDAIAVVGIRNLKTAQPTSVTAVCIDGGTKRVAIKNGAASFKILIDGLIDAVSAITVSETHIPLSASSVAALQALKIQWALLFDEGLI